MALVDGGFEEPDMRANGYEGVIYVLNIDRITLPSFFANRIDVYTPFLGEAGILFEGLATGRGVWLLQGDGNSDPILAKPQLLFRQT